MMLAEQSRPMKEAKPNEASLYGGHWWSSDMTVDHTPVVPLKKSLGIVVDSGGSLSRIH